MSVVDALIVAGGTACFMLFFVLVMMPKEQKSIASKVILVHAVLIFLILICFGGVQITKNPTSLALGSASENHQVVEKVVEQPAPFAKPSETTEKKKVVSEKEAKSDNTSSVFGLIDKNVDGYFADGTPYANYEIESGDTVFSICQDFDLEMAELKARNNLEDVEHPVIYAGAFLKVTLPE